MIGLIITGILILLAVVIVQIAKVTELSARIRGEEEVELRSNRAQGRWMLIFGVGFFAFCIWTAAYFKNWMLGYGPHESASVHGVELDKLFNVTLGFTGIVFILTHIALFWFTWKYHGRRGQKASFISHNNTLEIWWSAIPAVVMTFLVVKGLIAWNEVMADVDPEEDHIEIQASGEQFLWNIRYPGPDGVLGTTNFRLINGGNNPLGQDWNDKKNLDDFIPADIVLPVGKKVRVRITAKDVLHNFYLPHFRVKMDAVPGIPTYFVFTPTKTTDEYRIALSEYPEYQQLYDESDPQLGTIWENFNYELACAELCGNGHYSMKKLVRIVTQEEYDQWLSEQQSYYATNVRNTDADPHIGELHDYEIRQQRQDFYTNIESALATDVAEDKVVRLSNVQFETGSAALTANSQYELQNLADYMQRNPDMVIEIGGHTDNTGDADANLTLSQQRADVVEQYLTNRGVAPERMVAVGYGQTRPVGDNNTDAGRAENRRTEFKITAQ